VAVPYYAQKQIHALHDIDGIDWIGALRPEAIKKLATSGAIQMGLFDERNLLVTQTSGLSGRVPDRLPKRGTGAQAIRRAREFA
jgi:hypothetical protein